MPADSAGLLVGPVHSEKVADYSSDPPKGLAPLLVGIIREAILDYEPISTIGIDDRISTLNAELLTPVSTATGTLSQNPLPPTFTPSATPTATATIAPTTEATVTPTTVATMEYTPTLVVLPSHTPSPSSTIPYETPTPAIRVTKSLASFTDNDSSGSITLGDDLWYRFSITNIGGTDLYFIHAQDLTFSIPVTCPTSTLAVGGSITCTADTFHRITLAEANSGQVVNTAYASGDYGGVRYSSTSTITTPVVQNPSINMQKSLKAWDDNDASNTITAGDGLWYQFDLINTGNVTLANVSVLENSFNLPVTCILTTLSPGLSTSCSTNSAHLLTSSEIGAGELANTATASARFGSLTVTHADTLVLPLRLQVTKSVRTYDDLDNSNSISLGDRIWYQFDVANIGTVSISSISVTDQTFTIPVTCPGTTLASAASMTCTASMAHTVTLAEADLGEVLNTAVVTGLPASGQAVSASDSLITVIQQDPRLSIAKAALPLTYSTVGQKINYSFTVRNTGSVTITGPIGVIDDRTTDESCPPGSLAPGASLTCSASYIITQADLDSGSIVNRAYATGFDPHGSPVVSPTDQISITALQNPAVQIQKRIGGYADQDSSGDISFGDDLSYQFDVLNVGNTTVTGLTVTDDSFAMVVTCPLTSLSPGLGTTCNGQSTHRVTLSEANAGQAINTATARAVSGASPVIDSVTLTTPVTQSPALLLQKSLQGYVDNDSSGNITLNDGLTYQFSLTNAGNVTLVNLSVTENTFAIPVTCPRTSLDPSESMICLADAPHVVTLVEADAGSIVNTASAVGYFNGSALTATDSLTTILQQAPGLSLTKSADRSTYAAVGEVVTYTFTLTNSGNVTLDGPFSIADDVIGNISTCGAGPLSPAAVTSCDVPYTVRQYDLDFGSLTNTATAQTFYGGSPVASNSASVTLLPVLNRSYLIQKQVQDVGGSGPTGHADQAGDVISYQVSLTNTGNVALIGVIVNDPLVGALVGPTESIDIDNVLRVGETWTYTGVYTVTQADLDSDGGGDGSLDNTVVATTTYLPTPQSASVSVPLDQLPALTLVKSSLSASYSAAGQVLNYSYLVTNTGNVTLTGPFTITDDRSTNETCPAIAALAVASSITCTATYTVTQADVDAGSVMNTASAHGFFSGAPVNSPANSVTVNADLTPSLGLVKTAVESSYSTVGNVLHYSYELTNTGNVNLSGPFTITDDRSTDESCPLTMVLAPSAKIICNSTYSVRLTDLDAGSITNTATAHGFYNAAVVNSAADSVTVNALQAPALGLVKTAIQSSYFAAGHVLNYSYEITNTGNVTLSGPFTITDDRSTDETCPFVLTVAPGSKVVCFSTYTATQADMDAGTITNSATAHAFFNSTGVDSAVDSVTLTADQTPSLGLVKSASEGFYSAAGEVLHYSYLLSNTGNVSLSGPFSVTDDRSTDETCPATATLAPLASLTCTATYTVLQADLDAGSLINTASAHALFNSTAVDSTVQILTINASQTPSILVQKTLASYVDNDLTWTITRGDDLYYQFLLTNNGNVTIDSLAVTDDTFALPVTCPFTTLAPSDTMVCTTDTFHTISLLEADSNHVTNAATVTGLFNGTPYSNADSLTTPVEPLVASTVSGQVRDDTNANGNLGDNDYGLSNIKIELDNGACTLGLTCRSTLTDQNGVFRFGSVADGSYVLVETDPANYVSTADSDPPNDNQVDVIILGGQNSTNNIFLDSANPAVCSAPDPTSGFVVSTTPANGAVNVPLSLSGVTIRFNQPMITSGAERVIDPAKYELKNSANGKVLTILSVSYDPVTYTASLVFDTADPDWQNGVSYNLTIKNVKNACGTSQVNVVRSFTTAYSISGEVRNNRDNNGIYGVSITLSGGSCSGSCATLTTDLNGGFNFQGFAPGNYLLTETDLPGFTSISDSNGANDNQVALTLPSGGNSTGNSFIDAAATCAKPVVSATLPVNGATAVPLSTSVLSVTFSQPMITYGGGSVLAIGNFDNNIDNLSSGGDVPILSVSYDPVSLTATLSIDTSDPQWQPGSQFRLRIHGGLQNACAATIGTDVNVVFTTAAFISGQVSNNLDGKGLYGVTVLLDNGSCGGSCPTTKTDINGSFTFAGLVPGTYSLVETDLTGFNSFTDSSLPNDNLIPVTLVAGSNSTTNSFVDTPANCSAPTVSASDPFNGKVGVSLNTNSLTVTFDHPMLTLGAGNVFDLASYDHKIVNLNLGGDVPLLSATYDPATYTVTLLLNTSDPQWLAGSQFRLRVKGGIKNACNVNQGADIDILFSMDLAISGQVRNDLDGDGSLADLDPGIAGVTVGLYDSGNTLITTALTNSGGFFTFNLLSPGTYILRETDPSGYSSTADTFGANDNAITIILAAGANSIGNKFLDH